MPFLGTIRSVTLSLNHVIVQASVLRLKLHGSGLGQDLRRTRPADILASNWLCGKPAAFDLTVTSPLNAFVILEAGVTAGSAVTAAELRKHSANEDKCSELGWACIPLASKSRMELGAQKPKRLSRAWPLALLPDATNPDQCLRTAPMNL